MSDDLQFEEAEYDAPPQLPTSCAACEQTLGSAFWIENRQFALCEPCMHLRRDESMGFRPLHFGKAFVFGGIAAIIGGAAWGFITAITGFNIGLIAILVGAAIAMGINLGAPRGGSVYQVMAALLTYFAICFYLVVITTYYGYTEEGMSVAEVLLTMVFFTPYMLVMLIPSTLEVGGFIRILILGFAVWQAIQMTAHTPVVYEGPFATSDG